MKKAKFTVKTATFLFFLALTILTFFYSFSISFSPRDELWNFQNIFKIYNGSLIYKDCNVIITPIFFDITNILFHIFGANILTFRIFNFFIYITKFILTYIIFRKLNISKKLSILYLTLFIVYEIDYMQCGANYNQLAIIFSLIGIITFLTCYSKLYYHFIQGVIIFLTFFTKQTIGIYYAFGIVLFELISIGVNKKFWINQLKKLSTFLPLLFISLLIMHFRGNLFDFINLCFGGLFEFGNKNFTIGLQSIPFIIIYIITVTLSIIFFVLNKQLIQEEILAHKFLLCITIAFVFNMFPLVNSYHSIMTIQCCYILLIYTLDKSFISKILDTEKLLNFTLVISFIILFCLGCKLIYIYNTNLKPLSYFEKNSPFYGCKIDKTSLKKLNIITKHIKTKEKEGINLVFLTPDAFAYMVPLHQNNNELDLLFNGNLGYNGIEKTINKISNMENTEFAIYTNEDDRFYQQPMEIREYILNNFEKKYEFFNYTIYTNK